MELIKSLRVYKKEAPLNSARRSGQGREMLKYLQKFRSGEIEPPVPSAYNEELYKELADLSQRRHGISEEELVRLRKRYRSNVKSS